MESFFYWGYQQFCKEGEQGEACNRGMAFTWCSQPSRTPALRDLRCFSGLACTRCTDKQIKHPDTKPSSSGAPLILALEVEAGGLL